MHPVMAVRNNGLSQEYDEKVRQLSCIHYEEKKIKMADDDVIFLLREKYVNSEKYIFQIISSMYTVCVPNKMCTENRFFFH